MTSVSLHLTAARPSVCFHLRRRCTLTTCHAPLGMLLISGSSQALLKSTEMLNGISTVEIHFSPVLIIKMFVYWRTEAEFAVLGMVVWQCCCRLPQSRQTSLSCCRKSSGSRHLHSWNKSPQQLDSALRSTRYTVFVSLAVSGAVLTHDFIDKQIQTCRDVHYAIHWMKMYIYYIFSCVWYLGLLGVCSRSVCQHGKLQVFWRHQVHPKST